MQSRRVVVGLLAVALSGGGCSTSEVVERATEVIEPIESAFNEPTGTVDATTARDLLIHVYGAGAMPEVPLGDSPPACSTGTGTEEDPRRVEMDCATEGRLTGAIQVSVEDDGDDTYMLVEYEEVCVIGADLCMSGTGAFVARAVPDINVRAELNGNDVEVTRGGVTTREQFGFVFDPPRSGAVFFLEDDAFRIGAPVIDLEGTSLVTLVGRNGTFFCEFIERGAHGSCTGSSPIEW